MGTTGPSQEAIRWRRPSAWTVARLLAFASFLLILDALLRDRSGWDYQCINFLRDAQFSGDEDLFGASRRLTGLKGLAAAWLILLAGFVLAKRWLDAAVVAVLPAAVAVGAGVRLLVDRSAPDLSRIEGLEQTARAAGERAASFPANEVLGAVVLYGLVIYFAGKLGSRPLRLVLQSASAAIVVLAGFSRVWFGDAWTGDVLAAYVLGGSMLAALVALHLRAEPHASDVPFIHARPQPHDEEVAHAHALTSLILFRGDEAWKVYAPGFVPQAFYCLSFQAPFPYAHNPAALAAALHRRELAGLLTEYWYGERRVADLLRIDRYNGRPAVVSRFIPGREPAPERGRPFLEDLARRFDEAGLPTWQIDPRQPRSLGNVMETPDGRLVVIDLESGMVSPLASPRAWARAIRRAIVPLFDDVYFDVTRDYVMREAAPMRERMGAEWYEALQREIDRAEQTAIAWHASEPRIWSRILRWLFTGFFIRTWRRRAHRRAEQAEARATIFIEDSVRHWEVEGLITPREAEEMTEAIEKPSFQAVLPHFGVHLAIGVALRFPLGSIARVLYTGGNLLFATVLLLARRRDRASWKRAASIHSPLVLLIAAMPGVGTFSYMASKPIREQGKVARMVLDAAGDKVPWRLYQRLGIKRLVTRSDHSAGPPAPI